MTHLDTILWFTKSVVAMLMVFAIFKIWIYENIFIIPISFLLLIIIVQLKRRKQQINKIDFGSSQFWKTTYFILVILTIVSLASKVIFTKRSFQYSIFFFEANISRPVFSPKQMCAIESAARNNPEALVKVYTFRARLDPKAGFLTSKYNNIQIEEINMEKELEGTSMLPWWNTGIMINSKYGYSHVTDLLRFLFMWKYGGVYSDLDTITVKSYMSLIKSNKSGFGYLYERQDSMGVGILVFSRPRHPFLQYLVEKFPMNYDPNLWGKNGPVLAMDSLKLFCNVDNLSDFFYEYRMKKITYWEANRLYEKLNKLCTDLFIFPEEYFYPLSIPKGDYRDVFLPNSFEKYQMKVVSNNIYSVHFYGQLSKIYTSRPNDGSAYSSLAEKHCVYTSNYVYKNELTFH